MPKDYVAGRSSCGGAFIREWQSASWNLQRTTHLTNRRLLSHVRLLREELNHNETPVLYLYSTLTPNC